KKSGQDDGGNVQVAAGVGFQFSGGAEKHDADGSDKNTEKLQRAEAIAEKQQSDQQCKDRGETVEHAGISGADSLFGISKQECRDEVSANARSEQCQPDFPGFYFGQSANGEWEQNC